MVLHNDNNYLEKKIPSYAIKSVSPPTRLLMTLAVSLVLTCVQSIAQPLRLIDPETGFTKLTGEPSLSQSSINCIIQDHHGYLWFATWSGLVRYDGYSTTIFHSGSGVGDITSNLISTVFEDHTGNIWVGTHMSGLFLYNRRLNQFLNYKHNAHDTNSVSSNSIWKINEDKKGNLWIATENGLCHFNPTTQQFKTFSMDPGNPFSLSGNFVTDVFISHDETLWVATDRGINKMLEREPGKYSFERYYYPDGDPGSNLTYDIDEIIENGRSEIWFVTNRCLNRVADGRLERFGEKPQQTNYPLLRCMIKLQEDRPFFLLGSAKGLFAYSDHSPTMSSIGNFDTDEENTISKEGVCITSIFLDRAGVLWVGTKKGLYKSDSYHKNFRLFVTSTFDKANGMVSGLANANDDGYWISTLGGGLFKMKNGQFTSYRFTVSKKSYFADFIQTLFRDSRGNLWIGTAGAGVITFNPEEIKGSTITKFKHYHLNTDPPISADYIMSFGEDKNGSVWIGTWSGGLICIKKNGEIIQYSEPIFTKAPLVAIFSDSNGDLWIGTRGNGIYKLHATGTTPDVTHYLHNPDTKSLVNDFINDIYEDHTGRVWVGTEGGLVYYERATNSFVNQQIIDGPAIGVIVSILEDNTGKLWFSHWNGVTMIDPNTKKKSIAKNFDRHDHIQGSFYLNKVRLKDPEGKLLFGGSNGLNIIDPKSIVRNPVRPNILITQFKMFNKTIIQNEKIKDHIILHKPIDETDSLILHHNENSVSFEFAALDFAAPEKIHYAYKLEGFDSDWTHTDASRRFANYTNLNPGNYTFKVKAMNNDGLWSKDVKKLELFIQLPWWKTKLAIVFYMFVSICIMLVLKKLFLIRTAYIHDIKLERLQRENSENLNKAKLQFFTNVSHEFRTPLTLILAPAQSLLEGDFGGQQERKYLQRIHDNAQRLMRLVNQLLDFRKAETGNLKLQVTQRNIVAFIGEIKSSFDSLAEKLNIKFTFESTHDVMMAWFDSDQFEKIISNLLSNAFKNAHSGSTIHISVKKDTTLLHIEIEDSGKGIKPENIDKIFDSFFSYNEGHHHDGTGIGLALVKSLVDAHHGTIRVESTENVFTKFVISIPQGSTHFTAADIPQTQHTNDYQPNHREIEDAATDTQKKYQDNAPKLLVVEDNVEVQDYITDLFSYHYEVLRANNGEEALQAALLHMPKIIISDVMMPLMDGFTLCRRLKSTVSTSHIPIILLTARSSQPFQIEGLETGADDYIEKPFNPKILQLKVRNLVRSHEKTETTFLQTNPKQFALNVADERFLQQVLASIETNLNNVEYCVETLNLDIGMSRSLSYKKIKSLTGQSPVEFIRTIRLKRAATLLDQHTMTIAEVTYYVGFQDLQYFRECFKKLFGVTPSEYTQRSHDLHDHEKK